MRSHRLELIISLFMIVATLAVYWQLTDNEFMNFDDPVYVSENPHVRAGLTEKGSRRFQIYVSKVGINYTTWYIA